MDRQVWRVVATDQVGYTQYAVGTYAQAYAFFISEAENYCGWNLPKVMYTPHSESDMFSQTWSDGSRDYVHTSGWIKCGNQMLVLELVPARHL